MVDFANIYESRKNIWNSHFPLHITVRLAARSKKAWFWPKIVTKNYTFLSSIFWPKKWFKNRKSAFTATLKAIPWHRVGIFSLAIFAGRAPAIFLEPVSCTSTWLVRARKELLTSESHCERRTPSIPISPAATQSYQRNPASIALFTRQNSPKLSW